MKALLPSVKLRSEPPSQKQREGISTKKIQKKSKEFSKRLKEKIKNLKEEKKKPSTTSFKDTDHRANLTKTTQGNAKLNRAGEKKLPAKEKRGHIRSATQNPVQNTTIKKGVKSNRHELTSKSSIRAPQSSEKMPVSKHTVRVKVTIKKEIAKNDTADKIQAPSESPKNKPKQEKEHRALSQASSPVNIIEAQEKLPPSKDKDVKNKHKEIDTTENLPHIAGTPSSVQSPGSKTTQVNHPGTQGNSAINRNIYHQISPKEIPIKIHYMIDNGGGVARFKISPPELGRMEVQVRVSDGKVTLNIKVEDPRAIAHLNSMMQQLRDDLASKNLVLTESNFSLMPQSQSNQSSGNGYERYESSFESEGFSPTGKSANQRESLRKRIRNDLVLEV